MPKEFWAHRVLGDKMKPLCIEQDIHLPRRIWHMGTGLLGLVIYSVFAISQENMGTGLLLFSMMAFTLEFIRLRNPFLNRQIIQKMGIFMRKREIHTYSGLPFYSLGCALTLLLFGENIAHLSLFFLIFIDPIAGYFGTVFGKKKLVFGKSLEGFLAGVLVGFLTTWIFCSIALEDPGSGQLFIFSLCAGAIGACSEFFSFSFNDNLVLPFLSGLGLTILNQYFYIL